MLGNKHHTSNPVRPHPIASSDLLGGSPLKAELAPQTARTATTGPRFMWGGVGGVAGGQSPAGEAMALTVSPKAFASKRRLGRWRPQEWDGGPVFPVGQGHGVSYNLSFLMGPAAVARKGRNVPTPRGWFVSFGCRGAAHGGHPTSAGAGAAGGGRRSAASCKGMC